MPATSRGGEGGGAAVQRTRFRLRVRQRRSGGGWREASGLTTVTLEGSLQAGGLGDSVQVWALLGRRRGPANPGERDWRSYFRSQRQLCSLWARYPECVTLQRRASGHPRYWLRRLRARCDQVLATHLDARHHGLAAAILLGARGHMTAQQTEAFFHTGTIHLLAISGLHVGILAWALLAAARSQLMPRGVALAAVVLLTAFYAALTEGRAPVVRATLLVHVICLSWWTRRRASVFNSLAAAAIVVLVRNPSQLFLPGAQLSFVAVAALAGLGPHLTLRPPPDPLQRLIWRSRPWPWRWVRRAGQRGAQLAAASLGVWIATTPLIQYQFCLVSPVAIVLNVVLWMPVALALFFGLGVLVCQGMCPPLASLWAAGCDLNLAVLQSSVERAQHWPGAYLWIPSPGAAWTGLFYVALGLLLLGARSRRGICCGWLGLAATWWLITALSLAWPRIAPSCLRATFLSVGHGTCVLLELPAGNNLLYDCGRRGAPEASVEVVARHLWWRRIRRLDGVILSHADVDHYNMLPGLLERFRVQRVYVPPAMFDAPSPSLRALKRLLAARAVEVCACSAGDRLRVSANCQLQILHPPRRYPGETDNAQSLVLWVRCASRGILLPGDLEGRGLERLLAHPSCRADVVMAPHHGSLNSEPAAGHGLVRRPLDDRQRSRPCRPAGARVPSARFGRRNPAHGGARGCGGHPAGRPCSHRPLPGSAPLSFHQLLRPLPQPINLRGSRPIRGVAIAIGWCVSLA